MPTELENSAQTKGLAGLPDTPCSASSSPRLRCREKWQNGFYGSYKGNDVILERDHKNTAWAFTITASSGSYLADGYTKEPMEMREAILYALKAAGLWQNEPSPSVGATE